MIRGAGGGELKAWMGQHSGGGCGSLLDMRMARRHRKVQSPSDAHYVAHVGRPSFTRFQAFEHWHLS